MAKKSKKRATFAPCSVSCCESPTDICRCATCGWQNHGIWLAENAIAWIRERAVAVSGLSGTADTPALENMLT